MGLTILCAGCAKSEREEIEAAVKSIVGPRAASGSWLVSLVKVRDHWSVTLEGPGVKANSFSTPAGRLRESIAEALSGGPRSSPQAAAPSATPLQARRDQHACQSCKGSYEVVYEADAEEGQESVLVACPHCWQRNSILVAEGAAATGDFKAQKVQA